MSLANGFAGMVLVTKGVSCRSLEVRCVRKDFQSRLPMYMPFCIR